MTKSRASMSTMGNQSGLRQPIKQANHELWLKFIDADSDAIWNHLATKLEPEQGFDNTLSVIQELDKELNIGFDEYESYSFALMLHALTDVKRFIFGGYIDVHHGLDFHNSVAEHSISVCVNEIIPLFQNIVKDIKEDDGPMQPVAEAFRAAIIRTLMHDMGETIMEFHSFAEESAASSEEKQHEKDDQILLEAEISSFFMKLALYASLDRREETYINALKELRTEIVDEEKQRSNHSYKETAKRIRSFFKNYDFNDVFPGFEHEQSALEARLQHYMKYYSHAEDFRGVGGPAVKIAQIIDGNTAFLKGAENAMAQTESGAVPYSLANNNRILSAYKRSETHLHNLFNTAVDGQLIDSMARNIAKRNYEVLIWHICMGPSVLHRPTPGTAKSDINATVKQRGPVSHEHERLKEINELTKQEQQITIKSSFARATKKVYASDIISARSQYLLYVAAYCNDANMDDLNLYDAPLIDRRDVPDALMPYIKILDYVEKNKIDITSEAGLNELRKTFKYQQDSRYPETISDLHHNSESIDKFFSWYNKYQNTASVSLGLKA